MAERKHFQISLRGVFTEAISLVSTYKSVDCFVPLSLAMTLEIRILLVFVQPLFRKIVPLILSETTESHLNHSL